MSSAARSGLPAPANRRRTAVRRSGRETAARITQAAYDLLRTEGLSEFSLRGIAKRAGVRLASVQYHFPSLEDLVRDIIALNARKYAEDYERAIGSRDGTPRDRLEAVIAFNLEDIQSRETRRFFIHLWSLLESLDGFSGSLLAELYAAQFALLSERVEELHPRLDPDEARRRAELIAALIEGMFITLPHTGDSRSGFDIVQRRAVRLCMAIADGAS